MKKVFQLLLLCQFVIATLPSCDDSNSNVEDAAKTIVVDGWIEQGSGPNVLLTWNMPYFSQLDSESIADLVIRNAKVTVSDCTQTEVLTLRNNKNSFPPYVYQGYQVRGVAGKKYYLEVVYKGMKITAVTTIPKSVAIDSAWFKVNEDNDTIGSVVIRFNDPENEKNYYRTYSKVAEKQDRFYPTFYSTFDDKRIHLNPVEIELDKGPEAYINYNFSVYYTVWDSIILKLTTVDEQIFNYWLEYQMEVINAGNPFATSFSRLESNISAPGLGIWAGYGRSFYYLKPYKKQKVE